MSSRTLLAGALLLVAGAAAACSDPGDRGGGRTGSADGASAERTLLAQRDDVSDTAGVLVGATRHEIGGEVVQAQGSWAGCTAVFPEGYADFQYVARVQLRAPGAPERLLGRLARAVAGTGLEVTARGSDDLEVRDGTVAARVWDLPAANADGDVTIELAAEPCVDVPRDDWRAWMAREDAGPELG